jgi:hypothetical protein
MSAVQLRPRWTLAAIQESDPLGVRSLFATRAFSIRQREVCLGPESEGSVNEFYAERESPREAVMVQGIRLLRVNPPYLAARRSALS